MELNNEIYQWVCNVALQAFFLNANMDNPDLDARYMKEVISNWIDKMPEQLMFLVHDWLESKEGEQWLNQMQFYSIVDPYIPEGQDGPSAWNHKGKPY